MRRRLLDGSEPVERDLYEEYAEFNPWFGIVHGMRQAGRAAAEAARTIAAGLRPILTRIHAILSDLDSATYAAVVAELGDATVVELGPRAADWLWVESDRDDPDLALDSIAERAHDARMESADTPSAGPGPLALSRQASRSGPGPSTTRGSQP